jgi:hypothetical protein
VDHGCVLDLVVGVGLAELSVRIALGVFVGNAANFSEWVKRVVLIAVPGDTV